MKAPFNQGSAVSRQNSLLWPFLGPANPANPHWRKWHSTTMSGYHWKIWTIGSSPQKTRADLSQPIRTGPSSTRYNESRATRHALPARRAVREHGHQRISQTGLQSRRATGSLVLARLQRQRNRPAARHVRKRETGLRNQVRRDVLERLLQGAELLERPFRGRQHAQDRHLRRRPIHEHFRRQGVRVERPLACHRTEGRFSRTASIKP